jgi:hypothetical protein
MTVMKWENAVDDKTGPFGRFQQPPTRQQHLQRRWRRAIEIMRLCLNLDRRRWTKMARTFCHAKPPEERA